MKPQVTNEISLKLLGCAYYGDPFHSQREGDIKNEIGRLWERFYKIYSEHACELKQIIIQENVVWEAHIQTAEYANTHEYTVFTGVQVKEPAATPIEFFFKELPTTKYAVFRIKGTEFITSLNSIYNRWLPNSKYKESYGYMLWRYDEKTKSLDDPACILQAYIPIEEKKK
jgi:AraC family transcriptional regulator